MSSNDAYQFDAFISYSRKDRDTVASLIERLRADGFHLWVDEEQIVGGDSLRESMIRGIQQSRHVICCLSQAYLDSDWGSFENIISQALDPPNRQRRTIPVQIAYITVPLQFNWLYCPNLVEQSSWEQEYQKVIKPLRLSMMKDALSNPDNTSYARASYVEFDASTETSRISFNRDGINQHILEFFQDDPFWYSKAEKMPYEALEATFVAHPGFEQDIMNLRHSAILLAPHGGGKTAGRLRLEIVLNKRQQQSFVGLPPDNLPHVPLVVTYNNFERIVRSLPIAGLKDHVEPLLAAFAESVYTFITTYPDQFMGIESTALRDWWWAFVEAYLEGVPLNHRVQDEELAKDLLRTAHRPIAFRQDSTLESVLKQLWHQLTKLKFDSLFILVDGVDGYIETQDWPNQKALIAPLLNTIPLLLIPGVVWKFFLPDILLEIVHNSAGYQNGLLKQVSIQWDEASLRNLLHQRLEWASNGHIRDIAQLCNQELLNTVDIEQQIVRRALQHTHLGPPRALFYLGSQFLQKGI